MRDLGFLTAGRWAKRWGIWMPRCWRYWYSNFLKGSNRCRDNFLRALRRIEGFLCFYLARLIGNTAVRS